MDLSNSNIIHQKKKAIEFLQFKKLLQYPELVHCYTLKINDFDVAGNDTYKDKIDIVHENYEKLANVLEIEKETIIRPYQNHTNVVKNIGHGQGAGTVVSCPSGYSHKRCPYDRPNQNLSAGIK